MAERWHRASGALPLGWEDIEASAAKHHQLQDHDHAGAMDGRWQLPLGLDVQVAVLSYKKGALFSAS